jgi:hypothetical protein
LDKQTELDAGALAIRNLGIIEQAYSLIDGPLSDLVLPSLERLLKEELSNKPISYIINLPMAESRAYSEEGSWFLDESWLMDKESEDRFAQFICWTEEEGNDDIFCLTQLCGLGKTRTGIAWKHDAKTLQPNAPRGKVNAWMTFAKEQDDIYANTLRTSGFVLNSDGEWFLPMLVSADALAEAYQDEDIDQVLQPMIKQCVDSIVKCTPAFTQILEAAKHKFGVISVVE